MWEVVSCQKNHSRNFFPIGRWKQESGDRFVSLPVERITWRSGWGHQGEPPHHHHMFIKCMFWVEHSAGFSGVTKKLEMHFQQIDELQREDGTLNWFPQ